MTAQEFEIVFYEAMAKWASGGKVGPDPRSEIEHRPNAGWVWADCDMDSLIRIVGGEYRWKPAPKRTVPIYGVELIAPEVEAPAEDTEYFAEFVDGSVGAWAWGDFDYFDKQVLTNGKLFLTREDAQAMADAQRKQRLRETK
jgi:hypothetical protein